MSAIVAITLPKTKIVCTIGPASDTPEVIRDSIGTRTSYYSYHAVPCGFAAAHFGFLSAFKRTSNGRGSDHARGWLFGTSGCCGKRS
jgi:hypothetical protein